MSQSRRVRVRNAVCSAPVPSVPGRRLQPGGGPQGRRPRQLSSLRREKRPTSAFTRLGCYLDRWLDLAGTPKTYEGIRNKITQELFLDSCPVDLAVWLRERKPELLEEIGTLSEQYLIAHDRNLAEGARPRNSPSSGGGVSTRKSDHGSSRELGRAELLLGEKSRYSSSGAVNGRKVTVYRDTGSSKTSVKQKLVTRNAYQEDKIRVRLANGTVETIPTARVELEVGGDTKVVEVGVMNTPYPVLLCNDYGEACVTTRRKQGYRDAKCPPTADVKSRNIVEERIQKLMREDPVFRRGRLRWLRRQQELRRAAGKRARQQEYGVK
ncbi:Hypp3381 [Branchiostoma lanceolatum]|uniref:Hypp3381 protein n=1 Tax=Branchiostoma lanceolatum TaxID=7740 RepID=A0A8K0A1R9_BRALA|nr:Hypp3381 [Branchiostoma lanceolatum]